jgi:phage-related protein
MRDTRPVSWIKAARKDFEDFPQGAQVELALALTIVAEGGVPSIAKPLRGFGSGVSELAEGIVAMPSASSMLCNLEPISG